MIRPFPRELRRTTVFRLALVYAGLYALLTAIVLVTVYEFAASYIQTQIDGDIKTEAQALAVLHDNRGLDALEQAVSRRSSSARERISPVPEAGARHYLLLDPAGRRLAGDLPAWPSAARGAETWVTYVIDPDAAARTGMTFPADLDFDDPLRVRGLAARLSDGSRLLVIETLDEADELTDYILFSLLTAIGLILIFGLAGGVWMGRYVVTRLESVRGAAVDIMAGDLSRRIPATPRRDEFNELATTLNAMLERIEELMASLRQVTDNVAHDLRSPLNRVRTRLEVTLRQAREPEEYRSAIESSVADADALLRTFNAMLNLAELEAGITREGWRTVALDAICEDVASVYEALAESRGVTLSREFDAAPVRGNSRLLAQAVGNLLDNAIKYTPANGRVELTLKTADGFVLLTLADSGPGVPAAEYERIFERFVRLDQSRSESGNGLGLSSVRAIIRLHGGRIELADNSPGLRILVQLPLGSYQ